MSRTDTRAALCTCGRPREFRCDWKMGDGHTCGAPLCGMHAWTPVAGKHLCRSHWDEWQKRQKSQRVS